jgi:hypothetical protein
MPIVPCPPVLKKLLYAAGALDIQRVYECIRAAYYGLIDAKSRKVYYRPDPRPLNEILDQLRDNKPELFTEPRDPNWAKNPACTYRDPQWAKNEPEPKKAA